MNRLQGPARIKLKVVIILVTAVVVVVAGAFVARHVRRRVIARRSLAEGQAALARKDWPAACKHLRRYLSYHSDNADMLREYAEANLRLKPLEPKDMATAIAAYRLLLKLTPRDASVYERLAELYGYTGNFNELTDIARKRLDQDDDDLRARIWLARSLLLQRKAERAREAFKNQKGQDVLEIVRQRPEKSRDYVDACVLFSRIIAQGDAKDKTIEAIKCLDRAAGYDPKSARALVYRASFRRQLAEETLAAARRQEGQARQAMLAQANVRLAEALADLEQATALKPNDLRVRSTIISEWLEHAKFDRAHLERAFAEYGTAKDADEETVRRYFVDAEAWIAAISFLGGELAVRRGASQEGLAIADEALAALRQSRHRRRVLPYAVRFYALAQRSEDARRCLDEYLDILKLVEKTDASRRQTTFLKALVARTEGQPYHVIELLEPTSGKTSADPVLWQLLAEAYSLTGQTRPAARMLKECLRLRPGDAQITAHLAHEYMKQRDWPKAIQAAAEVEPLDPEDVGIKLLRIEAGIQLAGGRTDPASRTRLQSQSKDLAALRESHPERVEVRILQAMIARLQGQVDAAEKELQLAIQECKETLPAELRLAELYLETKRLPAAIEACRTACKRHPDVAGPYLALSELQWSDGEREKAQAALRAGLQAVASPEGKYDLATKLAWFEILAGDRQTGIERLNDLRSQDDQNVRVRSLLLGLGEVRKDETEAQKLITEIHDIQGQTGLHWRLHEASLWLSGPGWRDQRHKIEGHLERCLDVDPGWCAPALLLAEMRERLQDPQGAADVLREVLKENPSAVRVAYRLVALLEDQKRFSEAKEVLEELDASPRVRESLRIRLAIAESDFDQAAEELRLRIRSGDREAATRILLARVIYRQSKDVAQALKYLAEAEAIAPESMALTATKVAVLKAEGRLPEARRVLEGYVRRYNTFAAYLLRATFLESIGQPDAEKDYVHLTTLHPKGYEHLGRYYAAHNMADKAVAALEKGVGAHPQELSLKRWLMKTLLLRGKPGDRERGNGLLAELARSLPNDPDILLAQAAVELGKGTEASTDKAQGLLERAVQIEPKAVDAHLALIGICLRRGEYRTARELAARALGANPESTQLVLIRADAERALRNWPMATELANSVLREEPGNVDALLLLARLCRDQGDLAKAGEHIGQAAKVAPDSPAVLRERVAWLGARRQFDQIVSLMVGYRKATDPDANVICAAAYVLASSASAPYLREAKALYEHAVKIAPRFVPAHLGMGWVAQTTGDIAQAEKVYRELLTWKPDNSEALNNLAWILAESHHDYKAALEFADEAARLSPENYHVRDTRAVILSKLPGRLKDAQADFQKCVELTAGDPPAHAKALANLGRVSAKLGQSRQAREHLQRALQIDAEQKVFTAKERSEIKQIIDALPAS